MKTTHTNEEWKCVPLTGEQQHARHERNLYPTEDIEYGYFLNGNGHILTKDEAEAKAKLIAAAPELLKALQKMYDVWYQHKDCYTNEQNEAMFNAYEAINKTK